MWFCMGEKICIADLYSSSAQKATEDILGIFTDNYTNLGGLVTNLLAPFATKIEPRI